MKSILFLKTTLSRLLVIAFLIGGYLAYSSMVKEINPDLEIGSATIVTAWPGADAQTIEQQITNKLEKELKSVKGLKRLLSGSFAGFSTVVVEFRADVAQKEAMTRVRTKVSQAKGFLPKQAEEPKIQEVSVNDTPIITTVLYGEAELSELSKLSKRLKKNFEKIPGVNKVIVSGDREEIVMISLINARLNALGISSTEVSDAIKNANLDMPWGSFEGEEIGATFRLFGRFRDIEQIKQLPIKQSDKHRTIYLSEIAKVEHTHTKEDVRSFYSKNGGDFGRSVGISITKQSGSDAIKVIEKIKQEYARAVKQDYWPESIKYDVESDNSVDIWASLKSVFNNGWQAMLAVFVILFISLSWREALLAGLAIPITFAATMVIIALFGYSLNQIVIIGLVLALGLLVDDFILIMEGMHDNIFVKKLQFKEAALKTVKTYAIPSLSGSLTTILAMAPLLGISGVIGKFIRPMPLTTIVALIVSYIVSLIILIPLSRYLLANKKLKAKETRIDKLTKRYSAKLCQLILTVFIRNKITASIWVTATAAVFLFSASLFTQLPIEMMPKSDGRPLGVLIEMSPRTSLDSAQACGDAVGEELKAFPYIQSVTKLIGQKSPFTTVALTDQLSSTSGHYLVGFSALFTPKLEREKLAYEYVPLIRSALLEKMNLACPGSRLLLTPSTGGASAEDPIQIELVGSNMGQLRAMAEKVIEKLEKIEGATDVRHNMGVLQTDFKAIPNFEAMSFHGVTAVNVADQIRVMTSQDKIGKFSVGGVEEDIDIKISTAWPTREGQQGGPTTLSELYMLSVINNQGDIIPLNSLVSFEVSEQALSIIHKGGKRTITVLAKVDQRTAAEILSELTPAIEQMQQSWPAGYEYGFAGEAQDSAETFGSAGTMLILALFLVFALLVLQFDSFIQPLIIMSAIPLALTGTFFSFAILQMPFSFMAMVGVIALIGIVVNNSIIMIETMNQYCLQGMSVVQAAAKGTSDRLRPIITTSITTIVGMIPLALSQKMWLPLGVTIVGGLILATFLSLLIVPCLYVLLTREKKVLDEAIEVDNTEAIV